MFNYPLLIIVIITTIYAIITHPRVKLDGTTQPLSTKTLKFWRINHHVLTSIGALFMLSAFLYTNHQLTLISPQLRGLTNTAFVFGIATLVVMQIALKLDLDKVITFNSVTFRNTILALMSYSTFWLLLFMCCLLATTSIQAPHATIDSFISGLALNIILIVASWYLLKYVDRKYKITMTTLVDIAIHQNQLLPLVKDNIVIEMPSSTQYANTTILENIDTSNWFLVSQAKTMRFIKNALDKNENGQAYIDILSTETEYAYTVFIPRFGIFTVYDVENSSNEHDSENPDSTDQIDS